MLFAVCCVGATQAAEGPSLQYKADGIEIKAASADEPKVEAFNAESIRAAATYLDQGALAWTRAKSCIACHTTGPYMADRPMLTKLLGPPKSQEMRTT